MEGPWIEPRTFAVAPVLNFSGRDDFDPVQAADLLASELAFVNGATVLPVNRVMAHLAMQGKSQVESPAHALAVARAVGADAIWVAGITEYDPYTPTVGVILQVYGEDLAHGSSVDAIQAARSARPVLAQYSAAPRIDAADQVQVVYSASHAHTYDAVRRYAEPRSETDDPLGWKRYLKVQTLFLRFCWHDAIGRVLLQGHWRRTEPSPLAETENPA